MKNIFLIIIGIIIGVSAYAQAPAKVGYQITVRNNDNTLVVSKKVGMRLSLLQGSSSGPSVYTETHVPKVNNNGLATIEIGSGKVVSGVFSGINWAEGPYFVKTEIDPTGGTDYSIINTNQLLSVPYVLHAEQSKNFPQGSNIGDMRYWNGTTWVFIPIGNVGDVLHLTNNKVPTWSGFSYPTITTTPATSVTGTTAISGGTITSDGGSAITAKGVCWSTTANPTVANSKTVDGIGLGSFTSSITGLTPCAVYYARAYVTTGAGTTYGNEVSFSTIVAPANGDYNAVDITWTSARSGVSVFPTTCPVTAAGVCWSTSPNPTIADRKTIDGSSTGIFTSLMTGLTPNTVYYFCSYATNEAGTAYGGLKSFRTLPLSIPVITTTEITSVANLTALSGGNITSDGGSPVTVRGVCWSTTPGPTTLNSKTVDGSGTGTFTSSITGLSSCLVYYVRAYATNGVGTAYGPELTFSTITAPENGIYAAVEITSTSARSGVSVYTTSCPATAAGICWSSTSTNPTIADSKTVDGSGTGIFVSYMTGLTPNTLYYFRGYATNSAGTVYGGRKSFRTLPLSVATITTAAVTDITGLTAYSGGNITSDGGATVTSRGVCWSTTPGPIITNNKTVDGSGTGTFTSFIIDLKILTTYYVRAYATNSVGTVYGNEVVFTTNSTIPLGILITHPINASSITKHTAVSGANLLSEGGAHVHNRGLMWSRRHINTLADIAGVEGHAYGGMQIQDLTGAGVGTFVMTMTNLLPNTTYYVRAYATNSLDPVGTFYGQEEQFTTLPADLPILTTSDVSYLTTTSANLGGTISDDGGGAISARGICWSTSPNPTIELSTKTSDGTGSGSFTSTITGLLPSTTYYVRAYAINSRGLSYGSLMSFKTNTHTIGQSYQGGVIFYILQPGDFEYESTKEKCLISATSDISPGIVWWNGSSQVTGATAIALNKGSGNTTSIINVQSNGNYAAKLCRDHRGSNYTDWYLPSREELNKIYQSRTLIGNFTTSFYWSSSEAGASTAYVYDFNTGNIYSPGKNYTCAVRPVRIYSELK